MKIGLDIGSTTLKCVVLDDGDNIIYKKYLRHFSKVAAASYELLGEVRSSLGIERARLCISGSAGMGLAEGCGIPFEQEVYATRRAASTLLPGADSIIELGGEDAKILFLTGGLEVRMNGSCAGGTGAFIDQMATLLDTTPDDMNDLAKEYTKIYSIASRCGVFAKSDIQPLLNQGAQKSDVSASIFAAVVNQTVAGLSQGRQITGNVVYLGGPLTFMSELRRAFDSILGVKGIFPENSLYFVAIGAAYSASEELSIADAADLISAYKPVGGYVACAPLFSDKADYARFLARHQISGVPRNTEEYTGKVYIGVDSGSTTVKAVALDENGNILLDSYLPNNGNAVQLTRSFLMDFYEKYPDCEVASSAVTGYGEELIKNAFMLDYGVVETIAHFTAAKRFDPEVDFIIDIGGQDIKCFQIHNSAIDNIFLNEACSSGCGSFLQTFAAAWGYGMADFSKLGLFADNPVDLGSRCTVFMNSSVKQAQKDGASIENISAGLSVSVVKNAIYKVIRAANADSLGAHIVVQGGTFLNDAVLRAFEQEIGRNVVRPAISGLMGAYGAALYAREHSRGKSSLLSRDKLDGFVHTVKAVTCSGCQNRCQLTVNTFDGNRRFVGGNRCERFSGGETAEIYSLYEYKNALLYSYKPKKGVRGKLGIPMGLNIYEMYPFWYTLFTELGFEVVTTKPSSRKTYLKGQYSIPSDTVCYPAKILHGLIEELLEDGVKNIFYPCMSYNFDEGLGDNHYNCPVVAYYPEVIEANVPKLKDVNFINDYIGVHKRKHFPKKLFNILTASLGGFDYKAVCAAVEGAYAEYAAFMKRVEDKGREYVGLAKELNLPVIVLSGRPYHIDPEINHGIDRLICELGAVVVSEDAFCRDTESFGTLVLNQWTYHSRMYAAAKLVAEKNDPMLNFIQLVSFGCGVDAITTDECRRILESNNKIYTQIKIDEITNLGAVKIRVRSLFAAALRDTAGA